MGEPSHESQVPNRVVIHCADVPDFKKDGSIRDDGFVEINQWHKERGFTPWNGWIFCGYHYIVRKTGGVDVARPETVKGIHVAGANTGAVAICWVGRKILEPMQRESLIQITLAVIKRWAIPVDMVKGHCEHPGVAKTCPNFNGPGTYVNMDAFRAELWKRLKGEKDGEGQGLT